MNKGKIEKKEILIPCVHTILTLELDLDVVFNKSNHGYVMDKGEILSNEIRYLLNGQTSFSKCNVVKILLEEINGILKNLENEENK